MITIEDASGHLHLVETASGWEVREKDGHPVFKSPHVYFCMKYIGQYNANLARENRKNTAKKTLSARIRDVI